MSADQIIFVLGFMVGLVTATVFAFILVLACRKPKPPLRHDGEIDDAPHKNNRIKTMWD